MAKTWVLDTETKGTGAEMVPLEKVLRKPGSDSVPGFVFPELRAPRGERQPQEPHRFRVIDIMTRQALAEDVDARGAVQTLEDVRSVVDVTVDVWEPHAQRWRPLTFGELKLLWEHRGRVGDTPVPAAAD